MCLLHSCIEARDSLGLSLAVAHIDHGLRPTSAADAKFVEEFCQLHKISFFLKALTPPPAGVNIENWGRNERYAHFAEVLKTGLYQKLVTAHTASDVAETLLMRLLSNKELRSIVRQDTKRSCVRPFLEITRVQIEEYVTAHEMPFRHDESNEDQSFLRNRVRHTALPMLKREFDPRLEEVLSIRAAAIADDIDALYHLAHDVIRPCEAESWGSKEWLKKVRRALTDVLPAVQWRAAELLVHPLLGFSLGRAKSQDLASFFLSETTGIELPSGVSLRKKNSGVAVTR